MSFEFQAVLYFPFPFLFRTSNLTLSPWHLFCSFYETWGWRQEARLISLKCECSDYLTICLSEMVVTGKRPERHLEKRLTKTGTSFWQQQKSWNNEETGNKAEQDKRKSSFLFHPVVGSDNLVLSSKRTIRTLVINTVWLPDTSYESKDTSPSSGNITR